MIFPSKIYFGFTLGAAVAIACASTSAQAKCSIRVADPLITQRYQECDPRTMLSYLYNDLVTPFSFTCAKKLSETCTQESCADPKTPDERNRCFGHYVGVLNECEQQISDAAQMARCKDTKTWPVEPLLSEVKTQSVAANSFTGSAPPHMLAVVSRRGRNLGLHRSSPVHARVPDVSTSGENSGAYSAANPAAQPGQMGPPAPITQEALISGPPSP